jgi:enoyl-CoA hydratase/carnithine racemase
MTTGSDAPALNIRHEDAVAWLTLNRPDRLNALNTGLVTALREFFETLVRSPTATRVVVLQGAGRAFCAGLDLKERPPRMLEVEEGLALQRQFSGLILAMRRCPQPIIAVVQGAASGGGMALALASDIRLGTPDARLNAAFVRVGLSGCDVGVSYLLPRLVGASVASELLLTGRFLDAPRALALGLFSEVAALETIQASAAALATDMLNSNPLGLSLTKEALGLNLDAPSLEAAIALEDRNQVLCARTDGFAAAKAAFLARRPGGAAS